MNQDDELWAYDEPHESGGNCHVVMTRRQAIEWMKKIHTDRYGPGATDIEIFWDWVACHWAYKEETKSE